MRSACPVQISGVGCHVPERLLTNKDLEKMVDTSDEWILQRTGIATRHILEPGKATSDMAVEAIKALCRSTGMEPQEIEVLIVATVTPDMYFPATACLVQDKLGLSQTWGFDLSAACCGFVYAVSAGAAFVASGMHRRVVVVGADSMSRIIDYQDRNTCVLFGDGAGAVLLEPAVREEYSFIDAHHEIDGSGGPSLCMPAGGSLMPPSCETVKQRLHYVKQEGQPVFKFATRKMEEASRIVLERNQLSPRDLRLLIPHQANARIIRGTADRLGLREDQVVLNLHKYGNTTAATIPLAIRDALSENRLVKGDVVLLASVGAGFTVGTALLRWAY
ncbi:MAG: ketoacyl-ACP synthase III [Acidobacteriota bacterium]|nr:ketoacyl-ACP synthase III [Acidobacteriota bacterium]MDE2962895.1 ketoacyl-ACP synthase III [Acidobacteriota bacterium]MXZ33881.1 ketoacyl-ACP synthase III [Acidobacteriota bacterium]MYC80741.1 ketoacyl-ACP synthase III [Acidobacteriota bacterium]